MKISKIWVATALLPVMLVLTAACGNSAAYENVSEEQVTVLLTTPLYLSSYISSGEETAEEENQEDLWAQHLARVEGMNKEEKIALARQQIEAALAENEEKGNIGWQKTIVETYLKPVFPDLYEKVKAQMGYKNRSLGYSGSSLTCNVVTDENGRLVKAVVLDQEGNVVSAKPGAKAATISLLPDLALEIVTDEQGHIKEAYFLGDKGQKMVVIDGKQQ